MYIVHDCRPAFKSTRLINLKNQYKTTKESKYKILKSEPWEMNKEKYQNSQYFTKDWKSICHKALPHNQNPTDTWPFHSSGPITKFPK